MYSETALNITNALLGLVVLVLFVVVAYSVVIRKRHENDKNKSE